ncbi:MAG: putative sulfate exporter family transporter [Streptococcaceae bacterium]|jgi:uncharacterized integral membrane protein (TIGR00698 family)|nr:putative sulfate exporter family transporter [Streptococcaceae bacterium]
MKNKKVLPGILLSFIVGIISYLLNLYVFKGFGAGTIAILLGIILGNAYFHQPVLFKGTAWSEKKLLEYSVVLLGATVTFETIAKLRLSGMAFIVIQLIATIAFVLYLGKKLGFSTGLARLMAAGNAVCGSSAIVAVEPMSGATSEEKGTSITLVNLMGTALMLLLPSLSGLFFGQNMLLRGALIGGTVQSVGQVVASGAMIGEEAATSATLFKILRIVLLVFVVLFFGRLNKKQTAQVQTKTKKSTFLPWYVIGFTCLLLINSFFRLPSEVSLSAKTIASWCEIIALAAIGLRLNLVEFFKAGKQLLFYGLATIVFQVVLAVLLIFIIF